MSDEIKGIAGDRKFMDHYYLYLMLKKECEEDSPEDSTQEAKRKSCFEHYFAALNECFSKIDKLCNGDIRKNYLNWIRWNEINIIVELAYFKDDPLLMEKINDIHEMGEKIVALKEANFQLTETEKGVSKEYAHAFDQIQRKEDSFEKPNLKVVQQASRLLINYINLLTQRYYVSKTDREDYDHERLKSEAEYLITALKRFNEGSLAEGVETSIKNFLEFCELDNAAIVWQEKSMEGKVTLAHKRATEIFLETAIREIPETITKIKESAQRKMREDVTASGVLKQVLLNPIDTLKNVVEHPTKTTKALIKFAKKHPRQFVAIHLGCVAIGVCSGFLGGLVFFAPSAVSSATVTSLGYVGEKVLKIIDDEKREVEILEAKQAYVEAKNDENGVLIASDIKYDHVRRGTEENDKKFKEFMRDLKKSRQDQIDNMSLDDLNAAEKELSDNLLELINALGCVQEELKACYETAAIWFMQDAKEKNPVPLAAEASAVLKQALWHPIDILKNFKNVFKHPIKTAKALIKFARKHPWQLGAIFLVSIAIGVCYGGAVFGVMAAVHLFTLPITLALATLGCVVFGTSAISSTTVISVGNVGEKVSKINDHEKREVEILEAKQACVEAKNVENGLLIASDIKYDHVRRGTEIKKFKEFMRDLEKSRQDQIDNMTWIDLNTAEKELSDKLFELVNAQDCVQEESKACFKKVIEIQEKTSKIDEGKAAAIWLLQDVKEKNPFAEEDDSDSESE